MKKTTSLLLLLISFLTIKAQQVDSIIDIRDDQVYKVVKIGQQWWFQENLNVGIRIDGIQDASDNGAIEKYCYADNPDNCEIYGGLYTWDEMMDYNPSDSANPGITQGVCPVGWHLPTDDEWTELTDLLGGESVAGGKLKETGTIHWTSLNTGATNESGFTALPGGVLFTNGTFGNLGNRGYWWSSKEYTDTTAWYRILFYSGVNIFHAPGYKTVGLSVRCEMDSSQFGYLTISDKNYKTISKLEFNDDRTIDTIVMINSSARDTIHVSSIHTNTSSYSINKSSSVLLPGDSIHLKVTFHPPAGAIQYLDTLRIESDDPYNPLISMPLDGYINSDRIIDFRDSKIYKVVKIGQQWWMQENLNIGTRIDGSQDGTDNGIIEKYCYDNDDAYCDTMGGLYQWNEMMDYNPSDEGNPGITRGVCPVGWHLPTDDEWTEMTDLLGGESVAGGKLKETGTTNWREPNTGATNESGFTALPGGDASFYYIGSYGYWWSSTEYYAGASWHRYLYYNSPLIYRNYINTNDGFSVRCVWDSSQFGNLTISDKNLTTISKLEFTDDRTIDTIVIINSSAGNTINVVSIQTNTSAYNPYKSSVILLPGDSIHLNVAFNPLDKGKHYLDTLYIYSGDPYHPVISVPLDGYLKPDTIIDIRDGQVYSVVKIGRQWWIQENLNVGTRINVTQGAVDNGTIEKYCYDDLESNCDIYGGLYQWDEMMDYNPSDDGNPGITRGVCPVGWHLPTDSEWTELTDFLGGASVAGGKLKETGTIHWTSPNNGATNKSGFTALPGGLRNLYGEFMELGFYGFFWLSTESSSVQAYRCDLCYNNSNAYGYPHYLKEEGHSVRCLRDSIEFSYLTISDENFKTVSNLNFYGDNIKAELILINSSGGETINVSSIYTKNSAYKLNKSSSNLSPGDSIHLTITFDPLGKDIYRGTLFFKSDDPHDSLIMIQLNGTFPPEISFTDSTNISCFGYSDGSATVTPLLGTPPYQYQWDDPENATGSTVTGLSPNIYYHVTITDSLGWSVTDSIILSEPDSLEILVNITNVSNTGGSDGIIDITVKGGTEPYDYMWSNDLTSEDLLGIKTGEYQLIVEDHNGCTKEGTFRVKEPITLQFDKSDASCYGFHDGWINMTILGGNQPYRIDWSNDSISEDIEHLLSGKYTVSVTDDFGVSATDTVDIAEPEPLAIQSDYSEIICLGTAVGYINLYPSGGTLPYEYNWSDGSSSQTLTGLEAGDYSVKVTDNHGCVDSADFTIQSAIPYDGEQICIVTIDLLTGNNLIIWEKTAGKGIEYYRLYRENTLMGTVGYNDLSIFEDTVADPEKRPYLYKLSVVDTCGNESAQSSYHKPLFLQYISSIDGVNLTWSKYEIEGEVISFNGYSVYRGSDSTALAPLEEDIPTEVNVYTDNDPNALERKYYYRVAGILTDPCIPTGATGKKADSGPYSHSMSNIEDNRLQETPEGIPLFGENEFRIIPNPFSETTTLLFHNPEGHAYTLYIMDISGKVCRIVENINTSEYVLKKEGLQDGFYFVELRGLRLLRGRMVIE